MQLAATAGVRETDIELAGPRTDARLSRRFVVRCSGNHDAATARAKSIVAAMRLPDGSYHQLQVTSPTGSSQPLYVSLDESPANIARKRVTKRAARALESAGAPRDLTIAPRDGLVAREWTAWVEVRYDSATKTASPSWHDEPIRAAGVDPEAARHAFADSATTPTPPPTRG